MKFFYLILFAFVLSASAQKNIEAIKVTYIKSSNGSLVENQNPIVIYSSNEKCLLTSERNISKKENFPIEKSIINFQNNTIAYIAELEHSSIMTIDSTTLSKQKFEFYEESKKILGYNCKKAKTTINSNSIELWYTNEFGIKGAPSILGQNVGLVLEMIRNGNFQITATKIELLKKSPTQLDLPNPTPKTIDLLTYKDLLWRSRFENISVFKNEIINFSDESKSNDSVFRFAKGTIIVRKIKFPEIKKGSKIFVDVTEQSNGDAYDRTGSVFVIPTDQNISFLDGLKNGIQSLPIYENGNGKKYQGVVRTESYAPLLELMRFFTPFGVKKYNNLELKNKAWQDSVYYRQDISELLPELSNKDVWIGMNIGNYDKGGHKASLNISIHPYQESNTKNNWILPLFNTNNIMEMAGQEYGTMFNNDNGLKMSFEIPEGLQNIQLRYITTGHGGWENGDEYLQKKNRIILDENEIFAFTPWRADCGSYRLSNPASGNFDNGISSSDESRSNWCPGTVTNPIWIDLGNLSPGKHTMQIKIPQGAPEGNSFSSWNVSGCLIGNMTQ